MSMSVMMRQTAGAFAALCAYASVSAATLLSDEGRLSRITATHVTVDGLRTYKIDSDTRCYDAREVALTCGTLAGVGYADRARLSITADGTVRRLDIILLQQ